MRSVFAAAVIVLAAWPALAQQPAPLEIGAAAPPFSMTGVDGKTYTLDSFADAKILVMVFTCNHCPTAQSYEDRIQYLARAYRDQGVTLVAISPNDPLALRLDEIGYSDLGDSFEDMQQRAKDKGFDFPYLYDGDPPADSLAYGPVSTPHVFIFDNERKLRYRGRIDNAEQEEKAATRDAADAIEALLAGRPVEVQTTKTSGCSVKWSDKRDSVKESLARWAAEEVTLDPIDEAGVKKVIGEKSDKWRLVNLWATWCGPCVAEFPDLVTLHRMYRGRPFELITISGDKNDQGDKVLEFLKNQEASTRNYHFSGDDVYKLIEAVDHEWEGAYPYTILVSPEGEIVHRHAGQLEMLPIKKAIVEKLGRSF